MDTKNLRLDENESAFFARELEHIKAQSYDIKKPALKALQMLPVATDTPEAATTVTYQQFNGAGIMKIVSNYADDLPRADVFGKEFSSTIKTLGGAYGYNIMEIKQAAMVGTPLNARKANQVKKANDQAVNRIGWFGDATAGLLGMLNQPNVPAAVVPAGTTSGNVKWDGATPKLPSEILQDMNDAVTRVIDITLGVEVPNTVLLPVAQNRKISTTVLHDGTDTTIREFFLKNNPEIQLIDWVNELKDVDPAPSGGAAPTDVMLTYDRSPDIMGLEIPMVYQTLPPEARNLEFVVNALSRIGGLVVYYPLAIDIAEGI